MRLFLKFSIFIFLFFSYLSISEVVFGQSTCQGTYVCRLDQSVCDTGCSVLTCGSAGTCPNGGSGSPSSGTCCNQIVNQQSAPCSGLAVTSGSCSSLSVPNCLNGGYVSSMSCTGGGCANDNDCPGCGACNTGTGVCYDSNSYCSSGQYCSGATCYDSPTATPTDTPPPSGCTITTTYCGSACVSCGVTSDRYLDTCGNCVTTWTSGNSSSWCQDASLCGAATATPAGPTSTGCGSGFLCGTVCCGATDTCVSPGSGGSCIPDGWTPPVISYDISGKVFYDLNGNGSQDSGDNNASGIRVTLFNSAFITTDFQTVNTDSSGNYSFVAMYTNNNTLNASPPSGSSYIDIPSSRSNVSTPATDQNFGLWAGNTITGRVFIDTDGDQTKDATESYYNGASISVSDGNCGDGVNNDSGSTVDTADPQCHSDNNASNAASYQPYRNENGNSSTNYSHTSAGSGSNAGLYTRQGLVNDTYQVYFTVPAGGYTATTPTFSTINASGGNTYTASFGIRLPAPVCASGMQATNNNNGTYTLSVTSCTNLPASPPSPFAWTPDVPPPVNSPAPVITGQTDTPTSSTVTWTAPTCQSTAKNYDPEVAVGSTGNTTTYSTIISEPATYTIDVNVRSVTQGSSCAHNEESAYIDADTGDGAFIQVINTTTGTTYATQETTIAVPGTQFTCRASGDVYTVDLFPVPGYSIMRTNNNGTEASPGSSPISTGVLNSDRTITFCIAPIDPWFQTDFGDVRLLNLLNPVPAGLTGSTGGTDGDFPGIFFSSDSATRAFGNGSASTKGWFINGEYSYNANTENRNGGMSYDFFKSKANRDGVTITEIPEEDPIDLSDETQFPDVDGRIYEVGGAGSISSIGSSPITITGKRIVILAKGDVRIDQPIRVTAGDGILIIAAKGDITIGDDVGTATLTSTATQLDGYFTAQGSIIIESKTPVLTDQCTATAVDDLRLNVGGALVANSLKPFSSTGTGSIQRNRNLCLNNLLYPSLYIASRPDFLTQLTDFYKISYTKWSEVNP